jgi:uncharacterized protein YndB with AHSA1/START domain
VRTSIEVIVEVEIERPPAAVWSFVSDTERLPEWLGEFEAAHEESDGPTGVGTVVEWDPPRRMAWDGPPLRWAGGAARPRGSHTLAETREGRTSLVSRYQPELTGTQVLLAPYLKRWLRRRRLADMQTLKASLEAGAPS